MEIRKMVDRDTLTPEEIEALDSGEKTEEDFIREVEEAERAKQEVILEEAKKAKELAENYKIRAEKAESRTKDKDNTPKNDTLSQKDLYAMLSEGVHKDDFDQVTEYAAFRKISVDEALKSSVLKAILSEKKEERASAQATSTKNKGVGVKASNGNELFEKAKQTGEMPDSKEDLKKLIQSTLK